MSLRSLLTAVTLLTLVVADPFTLTASLPGNTLDGQVVNAAGEAFYLGLSAPATYCPTQVEPNCPNVTGTVISGMTAMWVEVPGGQQLYVAPNGALGFTQAHSASTPPGSFIGGFTNVTVESDCEATVTVFNWEAPDFTTGGIYACPSASNGTSYQIFAKTPAFNQTSTCVMLDGLLPHYQNGSAYGAWQYE